jgi:hypothetical protein
LFTHSYANTRTSGRTSKSLKISNQKRGDTGLVRGAFFFEIDEKENIVFMTAAHHRSNAY